MIMELSNRYILDWLEGTHAVGLFSAGYKLGIFGLIVVMGFNMGWTPYFLKRIKEENAKIEFSYIASLFLGLLGFVVVIISILLQIIFIQDLISTLFAFSLLVTSICLPSRS